MFLDGGARPVMERLPKKNRTKKRRSSNLLGLYRITTIL